MAKDIVREGVFAINKPCGLSSAQVLRECQQHFNPSIFFRPMIEAEVAKRLKESGGQFKRRRFEKRASQVKIGHGGTLDPLATGVLIMGIGSATKVLNQFLECTKTYETTVVFGAATDTYDRVGRVLTKRPYDHITREMVERELASFRGKQTQIPPLYSALKMDGKPLYEYAREGRPIPREIKGREVDILELELVEWHEPRSHNHHWPTEEAEAAERNLAEQVWRLKKQQEESGARTLTPEEREQDDQAVAAHESFKRKFEERQDELIRDNPSKRHKHNNNSNINNNNNATTNTNSSHKNSSKHPKHGHAMMSGALGQLPQPAYSSRGKNLVPASPDDSTPPPWSDEGPPACKIRLKVTSGFYVRSFCHDLGARLGSAGLMAELCRVRQSDFTVGGTNCLEYDDLAKGEEVWGPKVADMLARWNGEPHGQWPGVPDDENGPSSPQKKRLRSPPPPPREESPLRKLQATSPARTARTNGTEKHQYDDDQQSWNGFDD